MLFYHALCVHVKVIISCYKKLGIKSTDSFGSGRLTWSRDLARLSLFFLIPKGSSLSSSLSLTGTVSVVSVLGPGRLLSLRSGADLTLLIVLDEVTVPGDLRTSL